MQDFTQSNIYATTNEFFNKIMLNPYHRFRSWDNCFLFFRKFQKTKKHKDWDKACLHLGFFMASYGMYARGSFLLWNNHKIYKSIIEILTKTSFLDLWNIKISDFDDNRISLINECAISIWAKLLDTKIEYDHSKLKGVTETIVTKILLGTIGCTPGYDSLFKKGLKEIGLQAMSFTPNSIKVLAEFYTQNLDEFKKIQAEIKNLIGYNYPPMKLIDMYFWTIGYKQGS